ncbi:UDP-N-acetylmuramoyl-tripeptide--D-alanyl-D-alanine ligase [Candidatus Saccharibacteria bacterium]|nr:UDP-N-acetylmuramoyl-tripeptide--D-alanyl-D-alanine ligase [Candidatus Saccharibacteria bacterium]
MKNAFRRLIRPLIEQQVKRLISRHNFKVVAVAGSVGKTSTKTAIATVLAEKYRVRVHSGNYNDSVSVPLAAFNLDVPRTIINPFAWIMRLLQMERAIWSEPTIDILVLELGTDHPGELAHFMTYLTPDFGVVTAISAEHMEFFKTIEAVAKEEFDLALGSKQAILNDTFDRLHFLTKALKTTPIWYSDESFRHIKTKLKHDHGWDEDHFPRHILQAIGAAVAVATELKLNDTQITSGIVKFKGVPGRMQLLDGLDGSLIIDDTYNSSPDAIIAAMTYLNELPITGRRIAIMGRMNELGTGSPKYHTDVGAICAGVDYLITIGDLANEYLGPAAVAAGLDPTRFQAADSPYAAGEYVKLLLKPGDVVLAKGSQNGVFAEEAVKLLLAHPSDAGKLVRQSPAWLNQKRAQFMDAPKD